MGQFEQQGQKLGAMVDQKQLAYGDSVGKSSRLFRIFLEDYYNATMGAYVIKPELLDHLLLQLRIVDKQNRIFSNPSFDLMNESPYDDLAGYGLLGSQKAVGNTNATPQINNNGNNINNGNADFTGTVTTSQETTKVQQ